MPGFVDTNMKKTGPVMDKPRSVVPQDTEGNPSLCHLGLSQSGNGIAPTHSDWFRSGYLTLSAIVRVNLVLLFSGQRKRRFIF